MIEARRHLPTAIQTHAILSAVIEKPPGVKAFLPAYAQPPAKIPAWVRDDFNAGVRLGLATQPLYDALKDLEDDL